MTKASNVILVYGAWADGSSNYAGNAAEAESLVGNIKQGGGRALSVQADVSDKAEMRRMSYQAVAVSGGVDVLVNNAGVMLLFKRVTGSLGVSTAQWRQVDLRAQLQTGDCPRTNRIQQPLTHSNWAYGTANHNLRPV